MATSGGIGGIGGAGRKSAKGRTTAPGRGVDGATPADDRFDFEDGLDGDSDDPDLAHVLEAHPAREDGRKHSDDLPLRPIWHEARLVELERRYAAGEGLFDEPLPGDGERLADDLEGD